MLDLPMSLSIKLNFQYQRSTKSSETHEQHAFGITNVSPEDRQQVVNIFLFWKLLTFSISLRAAPLSFPKGFKKIFENVGGTTGETVSIPFSGQRSCFSTSSEEMNKSITSFISSCDAYSIAARPSPAWQN